MSPAEFKQIKNKIKARQPVIMAAMANNAVNHFVKSFDDQGFTDENRIGWVRRESRRDDNARAILTKSGRLKRSIRVKSVNADKAVIGTGGVPYARIHNEGLDGLAWGRHRFKMPKRQFIGRSRKLNRINKQLIVNEVKRLFK